MDEDRIPAARKGSLNSWSVELEDSRMLNEVLPELWNQAKEKFETRGAAKLDPRSSGSDSEHRKSDKPLNYDLRTSMASPSEDFRALLKAERIVKEPEKPAGREEWDKEYYNKKAPELLYCDPKRLEYYDDGSLRIFDTDIIKAIYVWAAEHGMEDGLQGGGVIVNGRGC